MRKDCCDLPASALLIFARVPLPGRVKKRLIPALGEAGACRLYQAMAEDIVSRFAGDSAARGGYSADLVLTGEMDAESLPEQWASISHFNQTGESLGERMWNAFRQAFARGSSRVALLGTDAPTLPFVFVLEAFSALEEVDVVLGPATDGGYYLLGASQAHSALFEGIDWGTERVLHQTLKKIESEGLTLHLLPAWYDVDDATSFSFLKTHLKALALSGKHPAPRTERCLLQSDLPPRGKPYS
ncbi:MAG: TIGR04282 family arsenosugar biosynthesis glycosyltransferase [Armatimonadetes bacterium]|nr:TIGR04282 family arsenosugar biosynthesis glycosyltransferase [Armatimonadota bacterium]